MAAAIRAVVGYLFLVFMVRIVGRRPGKQMNPFEFVLIFFIGGLALTFVVADDRSFTNAVVQILTIALSHYVFGIAASNVSSRRLAAGWYTADSSGKRNVA